MAETKVRTATAARELSSSAPKRHADFWRTKILRNQARDSEVNRLLRQAGWRVLRIWEHDLTKKQEVRTVGRIIAALLR